MNAVPKHEQITDATQLVEFCHRCRGADLLAFDTEFVSENRYRPQLCLVQVATRNELAIIDAIALKDLNPFWELVTEHVGTNVVHAAREEFLFCYRATGLRPKNLYDLQMVAGFVGLDYPAAYTTLVQQILGQLLSKGETRTDWRKRPLRREQINYALQDVEFLLDLYESLYQRLQAFDRVRWYEDELNQRLSELESIETSSQWRRLPGMSRFNRTALAIARQLYEWRDREAKHADRTPRRILPDDLLIEIAKRGEANPTRLKDIRGLQNRISERYLSTIGHQVQRALDLPDDELPQRVPVHHSVSLGLLGQYLTTSLSLICVDLNLSPALVASASEVRNIAAWKLGMLHGGEGEPVLKGWRAEVVGKLVEDVLSGRVGMRVADPHSSQPLKLEAWPDSHPNEQRQNAK